MGVSCLQEMQQQVMHSIEAYDPPEGQGSWQTCLHRVVLDYLVHHGYTSTALAFSSSTAQPIHESHASIRNRQRECLCAQEGVCTGRGVVYTGSGVYRKGRCRGSGVHIQEVVLTGSGVYIQEVVLTVSGVYIQEVVCVQDIVCIQVGA